MTDDAAHANLREKALKDLSEDLANAHEAGLCPACYMVELAITALSLAGAKHQDGTEEGAEMMSKLLTVVVLEGMQGSKKLREVLNKHTAKEEADDFLKGVVAAQGRTH